MKKILMATLFVFFTLPALAAEYEIDYAQSKIEFTGTHAGNEFQGVFEEWSAEIKFDADQVETSKLIARFNPATAVTGDKMYDGTLPQADWFDVKNHPEATFTSQSIVSNEDGSYKATGDLTIRGITKEISFDFTLSDLSVSPVIVSAVFPIDRLAYGIGKKSDAKAEWVSQMITLNIDITANAK